MISYAPFYKTLEEKQIAIYKLITKFGISRSLIDRLKHNKPLSTVTVDDLCRVLDCEVGDIMEYIKEAPETECNRFQTLYFPAFGEVSELPPNRAFSVYSTRLRKNFL